MTKPTTIPPRLTSLSPPSPSALATNGFDTSSDSAMSPTSSYGRVTRPSRKDSKPGYGAAQLHSENDNLQNGDRNTPAEGASHLHETLDTTPVKTLPSIPKIELESPPHDMVETSRTNTSYLTNASSSANGVVPPFQALLLDIPSSGLSEEIGTDNLMFSARGSMLIDGKRLNGEKQLVPAKALPALKESVRSEEKKSTITGRKRAVTAIAGRPQTRVMSTDEEMLSEKVRLFYSIGSDNNPDSDVQSSTATRISLRWQDATSRNRASTITTTSRATSVSDLSKMPPSPTILREYNELAGGTEDWQNVDNADVDRYGFIVPRSPILANGDSAANAGSKQAPIDSSQGLQRVSTPLQVASDSPRRRRTNRRSPSITRSTKSEFEGGRSPSNASVGRPSSSKSVGLQRSRSVSRTITSRFAINRDRRALDEAGDMLTLPRSSTTSTTSKTDAGEGTNAPAGTYTFASTPQARKKENERQDKWRRMARAVPDKPGVVGGGTTFTFDTTSPKLIERTWKGIPDSWRAAAWHCFLSASAQRHNKKHPNRPCIPDDDLSVMYHEYQNCNCPDDVQIDIDVPRTISSHIMFRRRYRGGQRLLFRVLHAISIHYAEQGYVQGMAALAATLLAYYEEEKAFIMLVRLWELRGLEKLYKTGFGGLMEALDDFERGWLGQGELKTKFDNLHIYPTAYGTRWYLTLFNYSIPFPAQLRVWDVFMLLGDDEAENDHHEVLNGAHSGQSTTTNTNNPNNEKASEKANFGTTLDILHATSAALIDGMRDILLESDFEDAMKALTSWIPIRDEDLFMRVAKAEWKMNLHRRKNQRTTVPP